jgi:hypothetical protein
MDGGTGMQMSLGQQIDSLFDLRERKRGLEATIDEIDKEIESRSEEIMQLLGTEGLERAAGSKAHVSVNESVVPRVEDREKFFAFIRRNNAFELLECRPSAPSFREWAARRGSRGVPGVVPFLKRKLSLTVNS